MRLVILSDANSESGVIEAQFLLSDLKYRQFFEQFSYGSGLNEIVIGCICRDPRHNFKQRIRMDRRKLILYMDLMFHLPDMVAATQEERQHMLAEKLYNEVPQIVRKYKLKEFDTERFVADLQGFLKGTGWI